MARTERRYVGKRFHVGGRELQVGEVVDATGWRHLHLLEDQRFLRALGPEAVPVRSADGRYWLDEATMRRHAPEAARTAQAAAKPARAGKRERSTVRA